MSSSETPAIAGDISGQLAVVVRSTDLLTDTRALRAIDDLRALGLDVAVLGWDRNAAAIEPTLETTHEKAPPARLHLYKRVAPHGRGMANLLAIQSWQRWVYRKIISSRPKLVYSCDLDAGIPSYRAAKRLGVPLVQDQFDPYSFRVPPRLVSAAVSAVEERVMKRADICIVADESRQKGLANEIVVGNLISHGEPPQPSPRYPRTVVFGGNLLPDRGLPAAAEAVAHMPDWRLIIAGDGPLASWARDEANRMPSVIEYRGRVEPQDILTTFASASAVLATYDPSIENNRRSAMSKIGECAVTRSPILVSRGTNASTLVERYGVGLSVEYGDVAGLMKVLPELTQPARVAATVAGWERYLAENDQAAQHETLKAEVLRVLRQTGDRGA